MMSAVEAPYWERRHLAGHPVLKPAGRRRSQWVDIPSCYTRRFPGVRLSVDGVGVRYKDEAAHVAMVLAGRLPAVTVAALASDLRRKLAALLRRSVAVFRI